MKPGSDSSFAEGLLSQSHPNYLARQNALILVFGFASLIIVGMVLLMLPISSTRPFTWSEAFFTSTSAVTVTGLGVITPAIDLTIFGQIVVMMLIEVGGIGFVAFSVLLFALIGRRLGYAGRLLLRQSLGVHETIGIGKLTRAVIYSVIGIQAIGAFLLWLRWAPALGVGPAAYYAIFHSVSAFCNAGFDLFSGTGTVLFGFGRDPFTLGVLMVLIIIGAFGILVVIDLIRYPVDRRLTVHTKLTLMLSTMITLASFLLLMIDKALGRLPFGEELPVAMFAVVSARTAGFTIFPLESLSETSQLMLMLSMFVGGAPASMAGGVTLSTVGVLLATLAATVRGRPQITVFERTLPIETIGKAVAIMTISTLLCFLVTLALLITEPSTLVPMAFEVISAFSNTGYSVGVTGELSEIGRLLIAFTMFWGRLGPLTLVVLLAQRERVTLVRYPTEPIVMG